MGAMQRHKGKRGEREACDVLRRIFPSVRRRAMQSRGGHEGADLDNTPGLHVEVGLGLSVNPRSKWEQAFTDWDSLSTAIPVAMTKRTNGPHHLRRWLVTIDVEAFKDLVLLARKGAGR